MKHLRLPTRAQILEVLSFDEQSGELTWRTTGSGRKPGKAGSAHKHGRLLCINRVSYRYARVVWFLIHGVDPGDDFVIDYADGDPSNDRPDNLRIATPQEDARNRRHGRQGACRVPGVSQCPVTKAWRAMLQPSEGFVWLGMYPTEETAIKAVEEARVRLYGIFSGPGVELPLDLSAVESRRLKRRSSQHRGVSFHRSTGKWAAYVIKDGKQRHLGLFASESEAAKVREAAELALSEGKPLQSRNFGSRTIGQQAVL